MKNKVIKIYNLKDIHEFVSRASKVKGDVLVRRGKFCIDGSSLMGVLSLDMTNGETIEYPDNAIEFEKYINQFEI